MERNMAKDKEHGMKNAVKKIHIFSKFAVTAYTFASVDGGQPVSSPIRHTQLARLWRNRRANRLGHEHDSPKRAWAYEGTCLIPRAAEKLLCGRVALCSLHGR